MESSLTGIFGNARVKLFRGSLALVKDKKEDKLCETLAQWSWKGILSTKQKLLLWIRCHIITWKVPMGKRGILVNVIQWYFVELKISIYLKHIHTTIDISFSLFKNDFILRSKCAIQKDNFDYCHPNLRSLIYFKGIFYLLLLFWIISCCSCGGMIRVMGVILSHISNLVIQIICCRILNFSPTDPLKALNCNTTSCSSDYTMKEIRLFGYEFLATLN